MKANLIIPIKNLHVLVIRMDNKQLGIIGAIIIIIVIIICAFAFLGGSNDAPANVVTQTNTSNDATTNVDNSTSSDGNYQLQINTTGKWRLDLTVDGKYSSDQGQGSKTFDLGTSIGYASVTVNQDGGPTSVYLLKDGEIVDEGSSNSDGIETIYFYYQIK